MKKNIPYRLIFAVVAGIATTMILTGITNIVMHSIGLHPALFQPMYDDTEAQLALFYHSLYAIFGGFITALIAKNKARRAVFILGTKELIMWGIGAILLWQHAPAWYTITKALLGIPLAWIGGILYETYKKRKSLLSARTLPLV
ncbi:MAG: hypothetical protein K0R26_2435 [Bacteroidota bacterium]|jgi:xanthine/uracil/vitamin C permease (AzgA family)|nr:hypothetical protein [Bacteroidota bacterium]